MDPDNTLCKAQRAGDVDVIGTHFAQERSMPDELEASDAYDKARDTAEAALEAYAKKDEPKGDKLVERAQSLDPDAVKDMIDDLEEDAAAEHDPQALKQQIDTPE
jgi:hypothetical protein